MPDSLSRPPEIFYLFFMVSLIFTIAESDQEDNCKQGLSALFNDHLTALLFKFCMAYF